MLIFIIAFLISIGVISQDDYNSLSEDERIELIQKNEIVIEDYIAL